MSYVNSGLMQVVVVCLYVSVSLPVQLISFCRFSGEIELQKALQLSETTFSELQKRASLIGSPSKPGAEKLWEKDILSAHDEEIMQNRHKEIHELKTAQRKAEFEVIARMREAEKQAKKKEEEKRIAEELRKRYSRV